MGREAAPKHATEAYQIHCPVEPAPYFESS